jgi:hypothetical protein
MTKKYVNNQPRSDELQYLISRHPAIFRGNAPVCANDVAPGWRNLIDQLLFDLEGICGDQVSKFELRQIKEKFGELRVYFSLKGQAEIATMDGIGMIPKEALDAAEATGVVAVNRHEWGAHMQVVSNPSGLSETIRKRIAEATNLSRLICSECGAPGEMRVTESGWYATFCDQHKKPGSKVANNG